MIPDHLFDDDVSPDAATVHFAVTPAGDRGATAAPTIEGYLVHELIGAGGCGDVFLAEPIAGGRRVAVKVLNFEMARVPKMRERFEREIMAVKRIGHPNIVQIHDSGALADGRPYYAMELLEGHTIRRMLQVRGRVSCHEALAILEQVSAAVDAAHRAGVVHRDIKASNVVVDDSSGSLVVKLLDFGIARVETPDSRLTTIGRVLGTPMAMAPEQIRGEPADERTDIYALGVLLYQLLTGQPPFVGPGAVEPQHLHRPAPRPSRLAPVPALVDDVVLCCLEKQRDRRYGSVELFREALRRAVGEATGAHAAAEQLSVALYFDVTIDTGDEAADDPLWEAATALDDIEQLVTGNGFETPLRTATMLLALQRLPDAPDAAGLATQAALDLARDLHHRLTGLMSADQGVGFRVCVHVERALRGQSAGGLDAWSGPLLQIGGWVPAAADSVVTVTASARKLLAPAASASAAG